jgi:hypothetical protein
MPKICYIPRSFSTNSLAVIHRANSILEDYAGQGFDLTLRQLYYQFVARGIIENKDTEYKKLGSIINDARMAGLIDWDYIVDRTRNMKENGHWSSPQEIIQSCAVAYQIDKWSQQPNYVEVWIEKDALVGVIQGVCSQEDVPYFSCRGYTSQSEMWSAGMRLMKAQRAGKQCHIVHLGDHDPSGIDMSRDIEDRLGTFMNHHVLVDWMLKNKPESSENTDEYAERVRGTLESSWRAPIEVHRIALNMNQVEEYNPPPNPAKITDSRSGPYINKYGDESWELDALEPAVLVDLIQDKINDLRDEDIWDGTCRAEDTQKKSLETVYRHWGAVVKFVSKKDKK